MGDLNCQYEAVYPPPQDSTEYIRRGYVKLGAQSLTPSRSSEYWITYGGIKDSGMGVVWAKKQLEGAWSVLPFEGRSIARMGLHLHTDLKVWWGFNAPLGWWGGAVFSSRIQQSRRLCQKRVYSKRGARQAMDCNEQPLASSNFLLISWYTVVRITFDSGKAF